MADVTSIFQRHRIGLPDDERRDLHSSFKVSGGQATRYHPVVDRVILEAPGNLDLSVPPISLVSVTGSSDTKVAIRVWAELTGTMTVDAFAPVRLTSEGGRVGLTGVPTLPIPVILRWDLIVPAENPLSIRGDHAAVDICGVTGPVKVATGHGRVCVLNSGPNLDVRADAGGWIVWGGGSGGAIDLYADGQIKLRLIETRFAGQIKALARGSIDVYLPIDFESPFQIEVPTVDRLECDDQIRARLTGAQASPPAILQSGAQPVAKFVSLEGTVSIHHDES